MKRRTVVLMLLIGVVGASAAAVPAHAGGGCHEMQEEVTSARASGTVTVPMEECGFSPTVLHVDPGTVVTWTNRDPVPHTVTGALFTWGDQAGIQRGGEVSHRFEDEGVFPYYCILHPGMVAAVVVGNPDAGAAAAAPIQPAAGPQAPAGATDTERRAADTTSPWAAAGLGLAIVVLTAAAGVALVRRRPQRAVA
ncbi:MAG: hypothetical protein ABR575_10275 [Actinomycetota bacterium]